MMSEMRAASAAAREEDVARVVEASSRPAHYNVDDESSKRKGFNGVALSSCDASRTLSKRGVTVKKKKKKKGLRDRRYYGV